jgi:Do/DeqQ family serine protease
MLLGAGLAVGSGYGIYWFQTQANSSSPASSTENTLPSQSPVAQLQVPGNDLNFIEAIVNQVGGAVVRIDSTRTVETEVPEMFNDPFFRRFFGGQMPDVPSQQIQRGVGSGFIISTDGLIITNAHVIDDSDTVTVTLKDGRTFTGKTLGQDPVTDVAVIQIEGENLPVMQLGDSDQLQPGQWAIAIGNPLGLDSTVTAGIISATGRSSGAIGVPDQRVDFIQTDVAINPGNSGGPLLNDQGQVVGMNTAIIQGAQSIGFAIPINTVKHIADLLVAQGTVDHPYLGIQMVTLTPDVRQNLNSDPNFEGRITEGQGVLIIGVMPNSPAAKAGLKAGDVINQIDGDSVTEASNVQDRVDATPLGQRMQVQINRNGRRETVIVRPEAFPDVSE